MAKFKSFFFKGITVLYFLAGLFFAGPAFSQQKNYTQVEISTHGSFFLISGDAGWGYGGSAKLLMPMEQNENYITLGITADRLRENRYFSYTPEPVWPINAVGGYRKMLRNFFIEPQLGIGIIIETNKADVPWETDKTYVLLNIFPGVESGIHWGQTTFSLSYRLNYRDPFKDDIYSIFSLKAGYRFGKRTP